MSKETIAFVIIFIDDVCACARVRVVGGVRSFAEVCETQESYDRRGAAGENGAYVDMDKILQHDAQAKTAH